MAEEREIVLSTDSGTYYTGVDHTPWSDNPRDAWAFRNPRSALKIATALEADDRQAPYLEGSRLELHLRDPEDRGTTRRVLSTADQENRPGMRRAWKEGFGEPLPVDVPGYRGSDNLVPPAVGIYRLQDHLEDMDWSRVKPDDPLKGIDASFVDVARTLPAPDRETLKADWERLAPPGVAYPDFGAKPAVGRSAPDTNEVERADRTPAPAAPLPTEAAVPTTVGRGPSRAYLEAEEYLAAVDWKAIRERNHGAPETRGEMGLDPKFWSTTTRLSLTEPGKAQAEALWAKYAPDDFPRLFDANRDRGSAPSPAPATEPPAPAPAAAPNEVERADRAPSRVAPGASDDFDPEQVRARAAAVRSRTPGTQDDSQERVRTPDATPGKEPAPIPAASAGAPTEPAAVLPTYVRRHFVNKGEDFYYRDQPAKLAFQTQGETFKARDPSVAVATALVEMAQAKGWGAIKVKGTDEFKRRVWEAAQERGLKVDGYTPGPGEQARAAERRPASAAPQSSSPAPASAPAAADPKEGRSPALQGHRDEAPGQPQRGQRPVLRGTLHSHGEAPYRHQEGGSASYHVTLRDSDGRTHAHWGVDLKRAIKESGAQVGDPLQLQRLGKQTVEIKVREVGDDGQTRRVPKDVERERWSARIQERDPRAEALSAFVDRAMPDLPRDKRELLVQRARAPERQPESGAERKPKARTPARETR